MKLSTKLISSFTIVVLVVGAIGLTASYFNDAVKDQVTFESDKAIKEVTLAGEMGIQLFKSLTRTQYLLEDSYRETLSMDYSRSNRSKEVQIAKINKSLGEFEKSLEELKRLVKSDQDNFFEPSIDSSRVLSLLKNLEKKYQNYSSLLIQFQNISTENYQDRKEFFTVTIEPYFRSNLLPEIDRLRNHIQETHRKQIAGLNSQLDRVGYILVIATGIALVVAIVLALFIYRSIANPISKIAVAAQSVGQGNLQNRINYNSNDELGQLSSTFDRMAENLSKITVSRDYVDSIIEAMADLLVVTDRDFKIIRINSAVSDILGFTEEELLEESIDTLFNEMPKNIFTKQNTDSNRTYTGELIGVDKNIIPVSISRGKINGKDEAAQGYVFVASDISAEKEAQKKIKQSLKDKEVLLAEVHDRVKNNLAVITGMLQMQIWEAENDLVVSALQESRLRVQSIALVHEKLYQSDSLSVIEFDKYARDLIETIHSTYSSTKSDVEITTDLDKIVLNINQAIPCSLLINELVVNSLKHAFDDGQQGKIEVLLKAVDKQVNLTVKDNGRGFSGEENIESLGVTLIKTLAKQLEGTVSFKNEDSAKISVLFEA
ncbi:MAG: HAMP domain-containing protein, partial [Candidatus Dadabacteria bacterium]|nr:HAMP domain-containing protein [Candidatus Dadabacteria bacterium]NIU01200.1 HAMP domain-containing protein [Nitrosopumilaceae archaeon]NIV11595.1 HAMP domain-containing protein [Fodinibius sp.]NIX61802.1 HAMP domain-containing protein [Nitrosopumilaceae archaeon]